MGHSRTTRDRLLHARNFIISVPQMEVCEGVKFPNPSSAAAIWWLSSRSRTAVALKSSLKVCLGSRTSHCLSFLMCCTIGTASSAQHLFTPNYQPFLIAPKATKVGQPIALQPFVDKYRSLDSGVRSFQGAGNGHDNFVRHFRQALPLAVKCVCEMTWPPRCQCISR